MKLFTILQTFVTRFLVLALNFGLVIYTTNVWGSEGKGIITIVLLNLAIVGFCTNIFVGSSMSFFAKKINTEQLLLYAYLWSFLVGFIVPALFFLFYNSGYSLYLFGLAISASLLAANINLFVGLQKIKLFNLYSILQLGLHIAFIFVLILLDTQTDITIYFKALIFSNLVLFLVSFFQISKGLSIKNVSFSKITQNKMFDYGWKTQLSAFMQFLNYRFSYFVLEIFQGLSSVGIFSVGIAISEAIWAVSKSLSLILYSDVVNSSNSVNSILKTKVYLKLSFLITTVFLLVLLLIPSDWYKWVFGRDFQDAKRVTLWLSPGILAIAVSNIIGHYFSGINKLRILNVKSIIGLFFTVILSWILIPKWGILGASIATSVSYVVSSGILFWKFYQTTSFNILDYLPSKSDFVLLQSKLKK